MQFHFVDYAGPNIISDAITYAFIEPWMGAKYIQISIIFLKFDWLIYCFKNWWFQIYMFDLNAILKQQNHNDITHSINTWFNKTTVEMFI